MPCHNDAPLGVFDSGVGGLSILREIRALLPQERLIYLADQAHLPYGEQSAADIVRYSRAATDFFCAQGVKLMVVACNTATSAALPILRQTYPDLAFVGLEPPVRPAARDSRTGVIGVLATPITTEGERLASLVERFADGVRVIRRPCPSLVTLAERGGPWTPADYAQIASLLADLNAENVDQVVLGCTHFTFVAPLIQAALPAAQLVDPAPAVARRVQNLLAEAGRLASADCAGGLRYLTTGDPARLASQIQHLLGEAAPTEGLALDF